MSSAYPPPATQAETLLREWEQCTGPAAIHSAVRPAILALLSTLFATFQPGAMHINTDDVCAVLGAVAAFSIGVASTTGPERAHRVAQAVLSIVQVTLPSIGPAQRALLCILSPAARILAQTNSEIQISLNVYDTHELRMELLSYGPDVEVISPPVPRQ